MKQPSQEMINILYRARNDNSFAKAIVDDPERALRMYDLPIPELDYFKSFKSKPETELRQEYNEYQAALRSKGVKSFYEGITTLFLLVLSVIFVLVVAAYMLSSRFWPQGVTSLGLPLWDTVSLGTKWGMLMYGGLGAVFLIFSLGRTFARLGPTARVVVLIGMVIIVFVPGSVLIGVLSWNARVTLTRVLLTLMFTILPASLYSLFITTRGKTLWHEFKTNLAHLDPVGYEHLIDIYLKKYSALYGPPDPSGFGSALLQGETSFPVLFATFVVGMGWILFFFVGSMEQLAASTFENGFVSPFTFGFLGAYLFSLQMLFRRYVQSDLKSVAYTHISQRILLTWVWAFVLSVVPWEMFGVTLSDNKTAFVSILAFVVGVFPDIAWQVVTQFIRLVLSIPLPSFREKYPLHEIEGITIWVEARLLEEDVENIENLISTGIVDLMLRTNLKPERIVHWIDQGVLLLHLGHEKRKPLQQALRERGIITATDLMYPYKAATVTSPSGVPGIFLSDKLDPLVRDLVAAIEDDPNMYHVLAWREVNAARIARLPQAVKDQVDEETRPPTVSKPTITAPVTSSAIATQLAVSRPVAQIAQTAPTATSPVEAALSEVKRQIKPVEDGILE